MAIRKIRVDGDEVLEKVCRPIEHVTPRIRILAKDMLETMYDAYGVGLAAPQVGILRRMCVIDVTGENPYIMINPVITETSGEQTGDEGCLSIPGKVGTVTRPDHVKVTYYDLDMKAHELEAEGLLARACCHEIEHLDGILYKTHVNGPLRNVSDSVGEFEEIDEE